VLRINRKEMMRVVPRNMPFKMFLSLTCFCVIAVPGRLIDQLFNPARSGWRRALLLLANFSKEGKPESVIPKVSQEVLAESDRAPPV